MNEREKSRAIKNIKTCVCALQGEGGGECCKLKWVDKSRQHWHFDGSAHLSSESYGHVCDPQFSVYTQYIWFDQSFNHFNQRHLFRFPFILYTDREYLFINTTRNILNTKASFICVLVKINSLLNRCSVFLLPFFVKTTYYYIRILFNHRTAQRNSSVRITGTMANGYWFIWHFQSIKFLATNLI